MATGGKKMAKLCFSENKYFECSKGASNVRSKKKKNRSSGMSNIQK
jgi:hypothetical protein